MIMDQQQFVQLLESVLQRKPEAQKSWSHANLNHSGYGTRQGGYLDAEKELLHVSCLPFPPSATSHLT